MIDVQLRPGVHGCITVPLGCLTLGLMPLLEHLGERHFIRQMDEQGVVTQGGTGSPGMSSSTYGGWFLRWETVRRARCRTSTFWIRRVDESLPLWRTSNAQEVRDYALAHVSASVFEQQ